MEDKKIISLFFSRSEQAISETRTKYNNLCMKIANAILCSCEDAEECVNSAYLKLWNAIPPKNPESLCGYLCKIVRNTALTAFNKLSRRSTDEYYTELDEIIPDSITVEQSVEGRRISELLNSFLGSSKRRNREIFTARYYFNMSVREIADSFDMTETAVRSRLKRTREDLYTYLTERGVEV